MKRKKNTRFRYFRNVGTKFEKKQRYVFLIDDSVFFSETDQKGEGGNHKTNTQNVTYMCFCCCAECYGVGPMYGDTFRFLMNQKWRFLSSIFSSDKNIINYEKQSFSTSIRLYFCLRLDTRARWWINDISPYLGWDMALQQ